MATDIDDLQIKIKASASSAYKPIENLVKQLENLSSTINRIDANRFSTLANSLDRFGVSVNTLSGVKTSDFTRISNNLNKLANINYPGLNASANGLFTITNALSGLNVANGNIDSISRLASAISRLGYKSVDKAVQNMPQLSAAFSQLIREVSTLPQINQSIINFTSALANLANQGAKVGSSSNSLINALNGTHTASKKASKSTWSLARAFGKFYASYFLVIRGIKGLWGSIETTGDYVESFNYFTVAFGKIASEWDKNWEKYGSENAKNYSNAFVSSLNASLSKISGVKYDPQTGLLSETGLKNLGLNLKEVTQYAAQLSSMMNAVGQNGETTLATTNAFVKLAGDISSLFNIDYEEASSTLQSVMQGQSRAGYKFGWDTTMAALQATADKFDLSKPVSEMTQMEKQQLRILTILEQSKVAWGDQANTMSSLSNQIRLLKNNMSEMSMMLGQLFIPVLTNVLPVLNGMSIAIKRLLGDISSILGIQMKPENFSQGYNAVEEDIDSVTDSLDNLEDATNKTKRGLRGFDELNIIGTGAGIEATNETSNELSTIDLTQQILDSTEEYNRVWNEAYAQMENRAQEFADKISDYLEPIRTIFEDLSIGDYFKLGEDTSGLVIGIFDFFSNAIENVDWYAVGQGIGDFLAGIDWFGILQSVGKFVWEAINASVELWKGSFSAEPIATTILTSLFALPLLSTIVGSVATIFSTIGTGFTTVLGLFSGLGTAIVNISGALTGVTGIVTLFAVGLGLVYATNEDVRRGFEESVKAITDNFEPAVKLITETIIPSLQTGWENLINLLSPFVDFLGTIFTDIWMEVINPVLLYVGETVLPIVISTFENLWKNVIEPFGKLLVDVFTPAIEIVCDILEILWKNVVLPLADSVGNILGKVFENLSAIFNKNIIPSVNEIIKVFSFLWNNVLEPVVDFVWTVFKPAFEQSFVSLKKQIGGISRSFGGIIDFIGGVFTRDWSKAWQGLVDAFGGIWETIVSVAKAPINLVLGFINGMIDAIEKGINYIVDGINKLSFDVPEWVPGIGGETFGFEVEQVRFRDVPYLMNGGFVPKTADLFMANENRIPELVGTVGGKPAVASGKEITGISDAVYSTGQTTAELLNTAVGLLNIIAQKEFGVTNEQISSAAIGGIKEYANRNKKMPFPMYI